MYYIKKYIYVYTYDRILRETDKKKKKKRITYIKKKKKGTKRYTTLIVRCLQYYYFRVLSISGNGISLILSARTHYVLM